MKTIIFLILLISELCFGGSPWVFGPGGPKSLQSLSDGLCKSTSNVLTCGASIPLSSILGTANTFAGFDGSGALESVPGFSIDTTSGGQSIALTEHPNNGGGYTVHQSSVNFEPLQNSPNENWNIYNLFINMDSTNSGFTQGTSGNAVQALNVGFNHGTTGSTGALISYNASNSLGNGTDPVTIKGFGFFAGGGATNSGVTIDGQVFGMSFAPSFQSGSIMGSSQNTQAFFDGSQFSVPENSHFSFNGSPGINQINNNNNYTGVSIGPNIGTLQGNAGATGFSYGPTIGTINSGGVVGLFQNPSVTAMNSSSYSHGVDIYGVYPSSAGNIYGMQISPNISGGNANFWGITIGPNGGATLPQVNGMSIDLTQINSPAQKIGLTVNDGKIQVQTNYHTDILPASPGFAAMNQVNDEFWIKPGNPMSSTAMVANNFQGTFAAQDDMGPDGFGGFLGFVHLWNLENGGVAVGKTVDTLTMQVNGFSVADLSGVPITDGGTITNMNMFLNIGVAPAGGSLNVTNLYGFRTSPIFGLFATNAWAIYDESSAENYLNRLSIDTTDKKVYSDSKISIGDQTVLTGDNHAGIRNIRQVTDPASRAIDAAFTGYEAGTFTADNTAAIIGLHLTTKVNVASTKTIGGMAGVFNGVSRAESGDDGSVPFGFGFATGLTSGNSTTKNTALYASYFAGFHSIDSNANQVSAMYDFYAQASSIGAGAVTNRYGIVVEPDSGYVKKNWLADQTIVGGTSIGSPDSNDSLLIQEGHLNSKQASAPSGAANANAGTGATCVVTGTDTAFSIDLTEGSAAWASGAQCDVTFNKTYATAPRCTFSSDNARAASAIANIYQGITTSVYSLSFVAADTGANEYIVDVHCIGGN